MSTQSVNEALHSAAVNDLLSELLAERARADRLADRAVMLESRLAEVTREAAEYLELEVGDPVPVFKRILVVAEGES